MFEEAPTVTIEGRTKYHQNTLRAGLLTLEMEIPAIILLHAAACIIETPTIPDNFLEKLSPAAQANFLADSHGALSFIVSFLDVLVEHEEADVRNHALKMRDTARLKLEFIDRQLPCNCAEHQTH